MSKTSLLDHINTPTVAHNLGISFWENDSESDDDIDILNVSGGEEAD